MTSTIGRPAPRSHDIVLRRTLRKMIADIRKTMPKVTTPAEATALGVALRARWPHDRILGILRRLGGEAERSASQPWAVFDRARERGDTEQMFSARGDAADYDRDALLAVWSRESAARIVSVRNEVAEAMRRDIVAALVAGTEATAVAASWRRQGVPILRGTLEGRAKVIAQNQMASLHAQVQSQRARAVGVEHFVWRTQGDDRVRDEHEALDGTRHAYAKPPSEGLPGTPINCRCWAESVITDDLAESFGIPIGRGE